MTANDPPLSMVAPWARPGPLRTALLVMGSAGAAAIHFAMIPAHASESSLLAVGFAAVAWLQAAFGVAVLVRPTRPLLVAGAGLNTVAVGVWAWSRVFGLPFGARGEIEAVDALCVAFELAVIIAAAWPARATTERRAAPAAVAVAGMTSLLVIGATSAVLAAPGTLEHAHGDSHEAAHTEAHAENGSHDHATSDGPSPAAPAPEIDHTGSGHDHAVCTARVTATQQDAADELAAETRSTLTGYTRFDAAVADGFVNITPEGQVVVHYARPDWLVDGEVLDPSAPESLVYAFPKRMSPVLLGAMYLVDGNADPPTPGGCLTQWHDHANLCLAPGEGMVAFVGADGTCPDGSSNTQTQAMMHVWRYDTSAGPFAELNAVPVDELRAAIVADLRPS